MATYSITRALNELKLLDGRINRGIGSNALVAVQIGEKKINSHIEVEEFNKTATDSLKSTQDLIARRSKIKSAIIASNAVTKVKFPSGKEMTVAEVIDRKTSIVYDSNLLVNLRRQYNEVLNKLEKETQKFKDGLNAHIETTLGKMDASKIAKEADNIKILTDAYTRQHEPKLVNPTDLKKVIDELEKSIEEFNSECDFLLSESNTMTTIDIED